MMAYAVLGRGMLSVEVLKAEEMAVDDIRPELPRFHSANLANNLRLRSAFEAIAREERHARPARHCLANDPGLARGCLYRADTGREIARTP